MALDLSAIGTVGDPVERTWTSKDALLYALGVGAGMADPTTELEFTTENTRDLPQQVLPTFGVLLGMGAGGSRSIGTFNRAMLVHAEQAIEIFRPLTPDGAVTVTGTLVDIVDKRSGALVVTEATGVDPTDGERVFATRSGMFIRGEGGFSAGDSDQRPSQASPPPLPEREPDYTITYATLPSQALLYRLSGDRNPLHSDPGFAARGGFDRPILHGLCTYGFTGRALLHVLCGGDPSRFRSMYGRFSKPVLPGQDLTVDIWLGDTGTAVFRTTAGGATVIDRGHCTFA